MPPRPQPARLPASGDRHVPTGMSSHTVITCSHMFTPLLHGNGNAHARCVKVRSLHQWYSTGSTNCSADTQYNILVVHSRPEGQMLHWDGPAALGASPSASSTAGSAPSFSSSLQACANTTPKGVTAWMIETDTCDFVRDGTLKRLDHYTITHYWADRVAVEAGHIHTSSCSHNAA